jgi:hypothetical protein
VGALAHGDDPIDVLASLRATTVGGHSKGKGVYSQESLKGDESSMKLQSVS